MGLNYDLGDRSENLRRMNHFFKYLISLIEFLFAENARFFEYLVRLGVKDWR